MRFLCLTPMQAARWSCVLGLGLMVGCAAIPESIQQLDGAVSESAPVAEPGQATEGDETFDRSGAFPNPQVAPQLIKRAAMTLGVEDVEVGIEAVQAVVQRQRGDLVSLSLQGDEGQGGARVAFLELRVPQETLDATLADLKSLGVVRSQSLTAEDVSTQLVDLRARVRNLRKSEEALLDIMERSGSIADVLEVSRELSAVREAIERAEAQLQALQGQVSFSTITLTMESTALPPLGQATPLGQTWQRAIRSVGAVNVGLLRGALWLLAFSPYWGAIAILAGLAYRRWGHSAVSCVAQAGDAEPGDASPSA
ncbi:MAG: DUF4349 domain-containing protein [Leptolyngbyaceae cyanobacterium T60_A2020_046]|nr:DUF4349 domain-containing protein [Leptolyngbyaceae cyanobacterium T60_A2020_046]